jgi:hypothetical protein
MTMISGYRPERLKHVSDVNLAVATGRKAPGLKQPINIKK